MRFRRLLISGLFGVGLLLLPFSYAQNLTLKNEAPHFSVNVAEAQGGSESAWSPSKLWRSVLKQVNGVLDFTAQVIEAVGDAPSEFFDIQSNDPPDTPAEVQNFNPVISADNQFPGLPSPQLYQGTLVMNVPLQVTGNLSVSGITRLSDLFVEGEFSINDLEVPGVGTVGTLVAGASRLGALTVDGDTRLNTLSVSGPVSFNNLTAGNLTVTNTLSALGGLTTSGADVDLQGGSIYASNVINEIIAGDNIQIDGTPNAPIISADIPSFGSRVRRLNGLTGTLTLVGGDDITISESGQEITVANTSDLSTVAARGGCTDCILDADVIDSLTISGGTIDNTVIGSTTAAAGTFSSLRIASAQPQLYYDTDNSNYVGFKASSTIGSNLVWTLPTADGIADQFLFTDGNGNLRFDDVSVLGVVNDLPDLGDVTLTAPASGDILSYDGAGWVNVSTSSFGLGDGTFLGLSDTPASYVANAVVVADALGSALVQSANFTFNGSEVTVGTSTAVTTLTVNGDASLLDQSILRFYEPGNGNYVGFRASSSLAGNVTWTLPSTDGSPNHVLVTDGAGNLRFSDVSAIGGGAETYLELDDTPGSYIANAIPYVATSSDGLRFSSNLVYNGGTGFLGIGSSNPTDELTVHGSVYFGFDENTPGLSYSDTDNTVSIGTTLSEEKLTVANGSILQRGGSSSEPYSPSVVGSLNLPDSTYDLQVVGGRAYTVGRFVGNEFSIIDISDRNSPSLVGSLNLPDTARSVQIQGDYAYVVTDVSGADFHVIDISDPNNPVQVGSLGLSTSAYSVAVRGRYAYVGTGIIAGDEFFIIDVIDPTNPVQVSSLNIGADINDVKVSGSYAYIVTDSPNNITSISISDPANPAVVDTVALSSDGFRLVLRGDQAFVVTNTVGDDFHIFDISDPTDISSISSLGLSSGANGVAVAGAYAYVTTSGTGDDLHIIDISRLSSPVEVGSVEMNSGSIYGIRVAGRYAYVTSASTGYEFHVFDLTGVEAQTMIAHSLESGNLSVIGDIVAAGNLSLSRGLQVGVEGIQSEGPLLITSSDQSIIEGNIGIGTTSAPYALTVSGDAFIGGSLYDSGFSAGQNGYILQSTVTGIEWVATSSLVTFGGNDQIPFTNGGASDFEYSSSLTFDGADLGLGASVGLALDGARVLYADPGNDSLYIGEGAGSNYTGASQVIIGDLAAENNQSGDYNTIVGAYAAQNMATGSDSVIVGGGAAYGNGGNYSASRITIIGTDAGYSLETGANNNILIGYNAAESLTTGSNNIVIGYDIEAPSNTGSNQLNIGNLIFGTGIDGTGTTVSSGNIGIGTTTPSSTLTVEGTIMASNLYGGSTGLSTDAQGNIIRDPSDRRLKTNIQPLENALEIVLALEGVKYQWIDVNRFGSQTEVGFIAQEVDLVLPEVVRKGGDYWSLNTQNILAVVIEAIKEMWVSISGNQEKINTLENRVQYLESLLEVESTEETESSYKQSDDNDEDPTADQAADEDQSETENPEEFDDEVASSTSETSDGEDVEETEADPTDGEADDSIDNNEGETEPAEPEVTEDEAIVEEDGAGDIQADNSEESAESVAMEKEEDVKSETEEIEP